MYLFILISIYWYVIHKYICMKYIYIYNLYIYVHAKLHVILAQYIAKIGASQDLLHKYTFKMCKHTPFLPPVRPRFSIFCKQEIRLKTIPASSPLSFAWGRPWLGEGAAKRPLRPSALGPLLIERVAAE